MLAQLDRAEDAQLAGNSNRAVNTLETFITVVRRRVYDLNLASLLRRDARALVEELEA